MVVKIRKADDNDCLLLWEWANDPQVRQWSFDSQTITLEGHRQWFNGKLSDPNCYLYIVETDDHRPVGQVRFDLQGSETALIDFSVQATERGLGYGPSGLQEACRQLFKEHPVTQVMGLVKKSNSASLRAFERAGFHKDILDTKQPQTVVHMALARADLESE